MDDKNQDDPDKQDDQSPYPPGTNVDDEGRKDESVGDTIENQLGLK